MKLFRKSRVTGGNKFDSVAQSRRKWGDDRGRGIAVLIEADRYYSAMEAFRQERERNKRYAYGDQWGDIICVDGVKMSEEEYIRRQGNVPLKNNLIRRLIRNIIGVYRSQASEPSCIARDRNEQSLGETMSAVLQCNMQLNRLGEVYARSLEEFLISGFIVHSKRYEWRNEQMDCWTEYVQPNNFFIDSNMRDFRGWDCSAVGEIHDVPFSKVMQQFAKSGEDCERLAEIYRGAHDIGNLSDSWDYFGYPLRGYKNNFLVPNDRSLCRVIEVWRKETKPRYRCHDYNNGDIYKIDVADYAEMVGRENDRRITAGMAAGLPEEEIPLIETEWFMDELWYYYYLSPRGDILAEGETPYEHKGHPYVFKAFPFIDGEIHSFVSDIIDQQRYVNRLITMYDWIMKASAKGVLLVPEDCIPEGMSLDEFADSYSRFNGVVVFKPSKYGHMPQQVASNATNIGIHELLQIQMKFLEDISGVNGALQGKPGFSGMSAALYSQQTQNATTSLLDLLEVFNSFIIEAAYKDVKNMQQYYDEKRTFNIVGRVGTKAEYDPKQVRDVEFDLSIVPSVATPAYRLLANEFLMQIWQTGQISLEQLLQNGNFPFADNLLQQLKRQQEEMEQQQAELAKQAEAAGVMPTQSGDQPMPQQIQQRSATVPAGLARQMGDHMGTATMAQVVKR